MCPMPMKPMLGFNLLLSKFITIPLSVTEPNDTLPKCARERMLQKPVYTRRNSWSHLHRYVHVSLLWYLCSPRCITRNSLVFPHSKAHPAGFRASTGVTHLVFSGKSLGRRRHDSVMSRVMDRGLM